MLPIEFRFNCSFLVAVLALNRFVACGVVGDCMLEPQSEKVQKRRKSFPLEWPSAVSCYAGGATKAGQRCPNKCLRDGLSYAWNWYSFGPSAISVGACEQVPKALAER